MNIRILTVIMAAAVLAGCADTGADNGNTENETTSSKLFIKAEIVPGFLSGWTTNVLLAENATVYTDGSIMGDAAEDADVSVAGEAVTEYSAYIYTKDFVSLTAGEDIVLSISWNDYSISDSLTMPQPPVITSPADNSTQDFSSDITFNWDAVVPAPAKILFHADYSNTVSGADYDIELDGDAVSYTVPGNTLKESGFGNCEIQIRTANRKLITGGDINSESAYHVENYSTLYLHEL